tara:strand:+ start:179 stop:418 length:240 start_codon:yes stop_codon:yes gene_type:complete
MENNSYALSDESIGQIAKLLQLAMLTGTDIVDNLRMFRMSVNEETSQLDPSPGYAGMFDDQVNTMLAELNELRSQEDSE